MNWLVWALGAFVFMGLANFGMKGASREGLRPAATLLAVIAGELPLALAYGWKRGGLLQGGAGWVWALAAGLATGLALILLNEAFARGAKGALGAAVMNANFVVVALLAFLVFKEKLDAGKLLGLGCTLAGLWLMAR